ncbi:MAG: hypothetical protein IJ087_00055 [Eggerthellaceae bacterium]|nr:hypothetical protein [Eggerthellaceae bacterium]
MTMTTRFSDPELAKSAEATYQALQRKWANEKPVEPPVYHRYVITLECTEEDFERIALYMRGFVMRHRSYHEETIGGG